MKIFVTKNQEGSEFFRTDDGSFVVGVSSKEEIKDAKGFISFTSAKGTKCVAPVNDVFDVNVEVFST